MYAILANVERQAVVIYLGRELFSSFRRNELPLSLVNHAFCLAARAVGLPQSDWNCTEEPVRDPGPGELLLTVLLRIA